MTRVAIIFLGALAAILMSYTALTILPAYQLATIEPSPAAQPYTNIELAGREIYIREGCIYCHSQQVRPEGFGKDLERGWGSRGSVPGDYVYDRPHLLGTMRTGPDLADIATRQPSRDWHLAHLYNPRSVSSYSHMPPYPWLFEVRPEASVLASERPVPIPAPYTPPEGYVVVPTAEAEALYAYLMRLRQEPADPPALDLPPTTFDGSAPLSGTPDAADTSGAAN